LLNKHHQRVGVWLLVLSTGLFFLVKLSEEKSYATQSELHQTNLSSQKPDSAKATRLPLSESSEAASDVVASSAPSKEGDFDINTEIQKVKTELTKIKNCLENDNCEMGETDSRALQLSLGRRLSEKVKELTRKVTSESVRSQELNMLAQALLSFDDGFVKQEALNILASQAPERSDIAAIGENILGYHDSSLVPAALLELRRHLEGPEAHEVHDYILKSLLTGSILVRVRLSESLGPFINKENFQNYWELQQNADLDYQVRRNLQSTLREWQLNESGG
jgi:hypothetical protein